MVGIGHAAPADGPGRGEVYLVDFEDIGGHVLRGPHPAVVVQADRLRRSSTVLLCPISSRGSRQPDYVPPYLARVARHESGLDKDGWVKCDQVFTRPASWLGSRLGRLSPAAMARVDASLRLVLAL